MIFIQDATLRDGEQGIGVAFTTEDRLKIIDALAALGVSSVETGYFDPALSLLNSALLKSPHISLLTAFSGCCRVGEKAETNPVLSALSESGYKRAAIFGKTSVSQVRDVLRCSSEENLRIIGDTVSFLVKSGLHVSFDSEHFFDGFAEDPDYALKVIKTAHDAGAAEIILCDTGGGTLPEQIDEGVRAAIDSLPDALIGIHCHNDSGLAVACSAAAVKAGAKTVQGTISGIGERCGNANLNTLIPLLQLKYGFDCLPPENLRLLTPTARYINEIANRRFDESEPFVGGFAFRHKAGTHIDATVKAPGSFEHIDPADVGNSSGIVISSLSGRAAVAAKASALTGTAVDKSDGRVIEATKRIKELESAGYVFDAADASLSLVIMEAFGERRRFFDIVRYQVLINEGSESGSVILDPQTISQSSCDSEIYRYNNACSAIVKVRVGDVYAVTADEGNGPVNAFDLALRKALTQFYPQIAEMRLTDYKVRVLDSSTATACAVRVLVESTDGRSSFRTVGVSPDVVDATSRAISDSIEYFLMNREKER